MGRVPCCEKDNVKRGQWTPEEDNKLSSYIAQHGTRNWRLIPKNAGLQRCGKSCRLRWTNYLRPDLKHEEFTESEEQIIIKLHSVVGNRWSLIAAQLPGRTDNDVKNHWNTKLKKKLSGMGIDPVTHKPFSHLMAEITTTLAPPQVAHLAEAALGCFKDEMLHLLTKKRVDLIAGTSAASGSIALYDSMSQCSGEDTIQKIKLSLSRAMQERPDQPSPSSRNWALLGSHGETSDAFLETTNSFLTNSDRFLYSSSAYCNGGEGTAWSQSTCTASNCTAGALVDEETGRRLQTEAEKNTADEADGDEIGRKRGMFETDCVLWDLADDLMIQ